MQNQFMTTPLLVSVHPSSSQISSLQQKNKKLKLQIMRIQDLLSRSPSPPSLPQSRASLFISDNNMEVLTKELANAYKRIKMYQYEINKHQDSSLRAKIVALEQAIAQKKALSDRLHRVLQKERKLYAENAKLESAEEREHADKKMQMANDQVAYWRVKIGEFKLLEEGRVVQMKKKYEGVKKIENLLLENGVGVGELEEIKLRTKRGTMVESKIQSKIQEQVESEEYYHQLLNQIAILQKVAMDYDKQYQVVEYQRQEAAELAFSSRNRLVEIQDEIVQLENSVAEQRNKLPVIQHVKPLSQIRSKSMQQAPQQTIQKILPSKKYHLLKFDEVGIPSLSGQYFSDRNILGQKSLKSKITGMTVFIDKETHGISGLQCVYGKHKQGGEHVKKQKQARELPYVEEVFTCEGYIKQIQGTLNHIDRLESLNLITNNGESRRFGHNKTNRKAFCFEIGSNQYPTCVFGTLNINKSGKSQIAHLGFQISQEDNVEGNEDVE